MIVEALRKLAEDIRTGNIDMTAFVGAPIGRPLTRSFYLEPEEEEPDEEDV